MPQLRPRHFGSGSSRSVCAVGKKVFGIERSTFVLDAQGNISREWRKVKAAGHAQAVLDALRETA